MQKTQEKRTDNPSSGRIGYIVSFVASILILVYLGYHFIDSFGTEITTETALLVTENDIAQYDGFIFRTETVVYSENSGGVGYLCTDGTKIRNGSDVASIYGSSANTNESVRNQIIELDRSIDLLNESNDVSGLAASDTATLDARINQYYRIIRETTEQGDYKNISKRRDEFLTLLNKRQIISGRIDSFDSIISDLGAERELLTASLDSISETVSSPVSGFFYSSLDGYEATLTGDAARGMTLESFDTLLSTEPAEYPSTAVGKVATEFEWYLTVETTRSEIHNYNKGYFYPVRFPYNNDIEIKMELCDIISSEDSNRVLLMFMSREVREDFSFRRMQPVEVVRKSYSGYKVPASAVRIIDGVKGVFILTGRTVYFRQIETVYEANGYCIVKTRDTENDPDYYKKLALYDHVITAGKDLYDGKMIT